MFRVLAEVLVDRAPEWAGLMSLARVFSYGLGPSPCSPLVQLPAHLTAQLTVERLFRLVGSPALASLV